MSFDFNWTMFWSVAAAIVAARIVGEIGEAIFVLVSRFVNGWHMDWTVLDRVNAIKARDY
jgi:hypothetical protein